MEKIYEYPNLGMDQNNQQINLNWPPPILLAEAKDSIWVSEDGEIERISHNNSLEKISQHLPLLCNSRATASRLNCKPFLGFDLLELFAFVKPAQFCVPTPHGIARALNMPIPESGLDAALVLLDATEVLLEELPLSPNKEKVILIAELMGHCRWVWAPMVLNALGASPKANSTLKANSLNIWEDLSEWSEHAPEPPVSSFPVTEDEAINRLNEMLSGLSETRSGQIEYTSKILPAFKPRSKKGVPHIVLAHAGTGVGKTLGYLAPSSIWADKNGGSVWVSTYTRNLQHQIDAELSRLYPEPIRKSTKIAIRKGRENYLCLLNLEEASQQLVTMPQYGVALGLVARWASKTRDGDLMGADFPSWLYDLLGHGRTAGLADRRGECIYSRCSHYHKCFIEKSIRNSKRAEIVIANHALVLIQSVLAEETDIHQPTRYIFDEGHHLFDAADAAFSTYLSGAEAFDLRRWLLGAETRSLGRSRGLKKRVEDLITEDKEGIKVLNQLLSAAQILPRDGWLNRIKDNQAIGPSESFFSAIKQQLEARTENSNNMYSLETNIYPATKTLIETAEIFSKSLEKMVNPVQIFCSILKNMLDEKAETLETPIRLRIESIIRSLTQRAYLTIQAWQSMLKTVTEAPTSEFIDWLEIERIQGRDIDIGMKRHWLDPTIPLNDKVFSPAHGVVITSATLKENATNSENNWVIANKRTGVNHIRTNLTKVDVESPFDYAEQTQVLIITDVNKNDVDQVAAAYRELFIASHGGALGLFTAIQRLRAVYKKILYPLDQSGLKLYAQHVDGLSLSTLIDIFRMEENSSLLGTNAARDGVDIPGDSLRLIVFDKVPWPRPTILTKARQGSFGRNVYTDMLTKMKLTQAFGRLIRTTSDKGVFVLLDSGMPSRLLDAFPKDATITRCGLADAIKDIKNFFNS